jgi:hypothetical protein
MVFIHYPAFFLLFSTVVTYIAYLVFAAFVGYSGQAGHGTVRASAFRPFLRARDDPDPHSEQRSSRRR